MKKTAMVLIFLAFSTALKCQEIRFLKIKSLSGSIRMSYQKITEKEENETYSLFDYREEYYQTGFELKMSGYCYHPNFLDFNIYGDIVANKTSYSLFSDETILNSTDNTYDLSFHFLKKKKFSFEPYFMQSYSNAGQRFNGRHFNKVKNSGFRLYGNTKLFPFVLDVFKADNSYSSLTVDERLEKSDNIELKMDILNKETITSKLQFSYKDYKEEVYGVDYKNSKLVWDLTKEFGKKGKNRFFTNFNYYKMSGENENTNYNFLTSVIWSLPYNFSSFVYLTLNENSSFDYKLSFQQLTTGLNHQLFESLTSSVSLFAKNEVDDAHKLITTYGEASLQYRKKIPTGLIRLGFVQRTEELKNTSKGGISTRDELLSFEVSDTVLITFPGVELSSVVVMDENNTRTYLEGVDYTITELSGVIYIERIPGGDIPAGSTIDVLYSYIALPDYNMTNHRYSDVFALRFLKFFEVAYFVNVNNSSIVSDYSISPFEQYKSRKKAYRFVSSFINGEYSLENYDGTLTDYETKNWQASMGKTFFKRLRVSLSISKNQYNYLDTERFTEFYNKFATVSWFSKRGSTLNITYRNTEYISESITRNRETLLTRFRWQFRQLSLEAAYEYIFEDTDVQNRTRNYFNLTLRRTF
jgi:hypothetical protein